MAVRRINRSRLEERMSLNTNDSERESTFEVLQEVQSTADSC